MVPFPPLDSPKPSFEPLSEAFAAKRGGDGGSVPCVVSLMGRLSALRLLCVSCRAYQCAARRCRAVTLRCEKLRFDQGCALGAPNAPVGPSLLDAQPKGVASEGKCGGVKRGIRNPEGVLAPSCPCRRAAAMPGWPIGSHSSPAAASRRNGERFTFRIVVYFFLRKENIMRVVSGLSLIHI